MQVAAEMPKYKSHKTVWALKIAAIDGDQLTPDEREFAPIKVDQDYLTRHQPQVGGYYVVYEGGYKSFSPAAAFESGYTAIEAS